MVAMGGGPDIPVRDGMSKEKELVLCTLPWPEDQASVGIQELKEAFGNVEVTYYYTKHANGKMEPLDVPEGTLERETQQQCAIQNPVDSIDFRLCLVFSRSGWIRRNGLIWKDLTESLHDTKIYLFFSPTRPRPSLPLAFTTPN